MKTTNYIAPEAIIISMEIEDAILQTSGGLNDFTQGDPLNQAAFSDTFVY